MATGPAICKVLTRDIWGHSIMIRDTYIRNSNFVVVLIKSSRVIPTHSRSLWRSVDSTRLAAPAHHEHVAAARRTALGEAHALVEAARARVRPVHVELDRHRRRRARRGTWFLSDRGSRNPKKEGRGPFWTETRFSISGFGEPGRPRARRRCSVRRCARSVRE